MGAAAKFNLGIARPPVKRLYSKTANSGNQHVVPCFGEHNSFAIVITIIGTSVVPQLLARKIFKTFRQTPNLKSKFQKLSEGLAMSGAATNSDIQGKVYLQRELLRDLIMSGHEELKRTAP